MSDSSTSNGWTQYQKLVLAELKRHDEALSKLHEDIVAMKLGQGKISSDISNFSHQSQKGLEILTDSIDREGQALREAKLEFSKAKEEIMKQKLNITRINVKIGAAIAALSIFASAAVSTLLKFFFLQ